MSRRTRIAIPLLALLAHAPLAAQAPARTWELGAQLALAPASRDGGWFGGQVAGVTQSALTLQAALDLVRLGPVAVRYVAQLDPLVRLGGVERYETLTAGESPLYVIGGTTARYGAALVPLGLSLEGRLHDRVALRAGTGLGVAGFTAHVPTAAGRQRNFVAQLEAALSVRVAGPYRLDGGLRWRHVSNGFTAWENPGLDSRLVFVGVSRRR
jgi:hypothetical protein